MESYSAPMDLFLVIFPLASTVLATCTASSRTSGPFILLHEFSANDFLPIPRLYAQALREQSTL